MDWAEDSRDRESAGLMLTLVLAALLRLKAVVLLPLEDGPKLWGGVNLGARRARKSDSSDFKRGNAGNYVGTKAHAETERKAGR